MTSFQGLESWNDFVSFGGVASLGVSLLFGMMSGWQDYKARRLDGAIPVEKLDELQNLSTRMPFLVAVRGIVASDDPKACELCDKEAVIHKIVEEEIWRKERENGRTVIEPIEIRTVNETREWFLDDGSAKLLVENASSASHLSSAMETKQVFVPENPSSSGSLVRLMIGTAWRMTKQGIRKTEHFLPVGTAVTAVGQVSRNKLLEAQAAVRKQSFLSVHRRWVRGAGSSADYKEGPPEADPAFACCKDPSAYS